MDPSAQWEKIEEVSRNPLKYVEQWKERTGGKVVGCTSCMPPFAPEELVHAAGMLPVGIWGAEVPVSQADARIQSFACSVARTSLEMALTGAFSVCDGFMFRFTCDAFQNLSEIWKLSVEKPCFQWVFPKKVDQSSVPAYLEQELLRMKGELEDFVGTKIDDASLRNSIDVYNENRRAMRELDQLRARDPSFLSPVQMMDVVLASSFLLKEEHTPLVRSLLDAHAREPESPSNGKERVNIFLTGVMPRPAAIASLLDEVGCSVLGDDMGLGGLYYSIEIQDKGDPLRDLLQGYLSYPPCSMLHDRSRSRSGELVRRVREVGAEGVLILGTKFCEPEFFDYPYLKEDLEQEGIFVLLLETELGLGVPGPIRTRLEAFLETLREKRAQP